MTLNEIVTVHTQCHLLNEGLSGNIDFSLPVSIIRTPLIESMFFRHLNFYQGCFFLKFSFFERINSPCSYFWAPHFFKLRFRCF